ncbi:MAG: CPBP family intramembrane metalloprotease [Myxococcales bacterium]|nr:CPBP family intramembrane metalloprotease [Myxococcales bacterium]
MAYRSAPSFCRSCGTPRSKPGEACEACGAPAEVVTATPEDPSRTARRFFSALALYFVLLGTLLLPFALAVQWDAAMLDRLLVVDTVLVIAWAVAHRKDVGPRLRNRGRLGSWVLATALVPVTVGLALGNVELMRSFLYVEPIDPSSAYAMAGHPLWIALLANALQPAVVEELAFRGVIFGALERVMEPRTVVVVTALMFTVLHLAMLGFVFLVAMGLLLGWLRLRSGSLYPAMWLHLCHNAVMLVLQWPS